jgi:linoleoyl-CoA desaturase
VLMHRAWLVLAVYAGTMLITGFLLSVVFQLAHSVGEADHPADPGGRIESEWAVHQVQTTVDFARRNPILTWCLGGLNHQVEHHLFPRVSHVHYPALSRIVEEVSARHGVKYVAHRSFRAALVSHFRFLREMGRPLPC